MELKRNPKETTPTPQNASALRLWAAITSPVISDNTSPIDCIRALRLIEKRITPDIFAALKDLASESARKYSGDCGIRHHLDKSDTCAQFERTLRHLINEEIDSPDFSALSTSGWAESLLYEEAS
tara:strand:- start:2575 stop:2949 length:375 start_codon:yes stop_codon:yes gene_type:complete